MKTDQTLRCAVCKAPMAPAKAAPVPNETIALRYHERLDDCVRETLAQWALDWRARTELCAAGQRAE